MGCGASSKAKYTEGESAATPSSPAKAPPTATDKTTGLTTTTAAPSTKTTAADDEEEESDDEVDDAEFEKMMIKQMQNQTGYRQSRPAISADAVVKDANWKPPVNTKTDDQETRLTAAVQKSFIFAALQEEDLATVIKAFQETCVTAGDTVIRQGDRVLPTAQAIFVVESGLLDVFKDGGEAPVFTYNTPGQLFGDLAVLYDAPRAATVIAKTDAVLWSLDRNTFNFLVKEAAREATQQRMEFLAKVPLFKDLSAPEVSKLDDAFIIRRFKPGDQIIAKGAEGNEFFLVEKGKCEAKVNGEVVAEYGPSSYFGELALLNNEPRQADVFALEPCRLMVLDRESFKRLLGPLDELRAARK